MTARLKIDRILLTGALLLLFSLLIVFISIYQYGISAPELYILLYLLAAVLILFAFLFQKIITDYASKKKIAGLLLTGENQVLEKIALNDPLPQILEEIVLNIETSNKGSLCSILLLAADGISLKNGASPNIPPAYTAAVDGIMIGEKSGSCGTAAFRKENVIVTDIAKSELWEDYKELALQNGLRACWSVPILSTDNILLGTFAMYYGKPQSPRPEDFDVIKRAASLVKIAIEKNNAATALSKSEEKYRTLVEQASDAIFIADALGRFVTVNTSATKISGYSEAELMQMNIYDFAVPEDIQQNPYRLNELKDGRTINMERVMKGKNNELFHVEVTSKLMKDGRLFAIVRNISERKKAEYELKQSEEKYRTLVEQASDSIFIADAQGRFITINNSAEKLSGYSQSELSRMSFYDFVIAEDVQKHPLQLDLLRQGKTATSERMMKRKDGSMLDIEITAKMLSDGRLLAFIRDISERKKASEELIKEKNLSDSIINSLPGVFYLYTREGKFLRWNKNFEEFTGYNAAEIAAMHPLELFEGEEKIKMAGMIQHVFTIGEGGVEAYASMKSKEKTPYYLTGKTINYEGNNCLMGLGINITQRVKAQEEIKETSEKLRQLTAHLQYIREEERKRIAREIHDELGQQLTAIKMDVAWIDKKIPEDSTAIKTKLTNIITLLDSSNSSIRKILNELRIGVLDHHGLVEALQWQSQQFSLNTGVELYFNCPQPVDVQEAVATCIFRVFQEALTNITRYANSAHVHTTLILEDGMINFTITDDGKGFDTELLKSSKSFGILGMKERVASINGKFQLISAEGKGTSIIITIPYQQ